jgi:hypothetical protein
MPFTVTRPEVGWSSPPIKLSNVDLPEPLGPITAASSPLLTVNVTPRNAETAVRPSP